MARLALFFVALGCLPHLGLNPPLMYVLGVVVGFSSPVLQLSLAGTAHQLSQRASIFATAVLVPDQPGKNRPLATMIHDAMLAAAPA